MKKLANVSQVMKTRAEINRERSGIPKPKTACVKSQEQYGLTRKESVSKLSHPPGPRIGLINLDKPETDVYFSRSRSPRNRDRDKAKFKKAQDAGAIGNPSKTPGVLDKGSYQDAYPQQPSVRNPRTKDYDDFVRRLRANPRPRLSRISLLKDLLYTRCRGST